MVQESSPKDSPLRVAIVGGGCAALSAAFELTAPELRGRFSVTVYQMGWRLGGKGASGRGVNARIEEHGLHLWMGYYENAFSLMRNCYAELNEIPRVGQWRFEDAFSPAQHNGAMDWSPTHGWLPWQVQFPAMPGTPGDPNPPLFDVASYLKHSVHLLRTLFGTLPVKVAATGAPAADAPYSEERFAAAVMSLAKYAAFAGLGVVVEGLAWLELVLTALPNFPQAVVVQLLDLIVQAARRELTKLVESSDEIRRLWEVAELILATVRGCLRFRLISDPRGFDAIDHYDCRAWLKLNGASEQAINSAFIRALYDLAFAYEAGDPQRPAIAAGSAIRGALRAFFTYRGAFFWKMNAGMGDVVFAPLYEVLKRRGVRFEFFHKLTDVGLSDPSEPAAHVTTLSFDVQARTQGDMPYQPLVDVKGLPCWPAQPDYQQLVEGEQLSCSGVDLESQWDRRRAGAKTLRVRDDFDFVVLGVALGVVAHTCSSLIARDEKWRNMVQRVRSVPTQAFQLWLNRSASELGWIGDSVNLSGFVEPFDTWADMTHLATREAWPQEPESIAYFCNVLHEVYAEAKPGVDSSELVSSAYGHVRNNIEEFLSNEVHHLWPNARDSSGNFNWGSLLAAEPVSASGVDRLDSQFWTANVRPSDRYSQSLPGTTAYRISPLDRTYDNLTVAGDWTSCSINMGCVEAAVLSGRLAAHALSGFPLLKDIVGYDHP